MLQVKLEVHVDDWSSEANDAMTKAVAAAATVQGLQSLVFQAGDEHLPYEIECLPADLLLPLTVAAGGPGSSLRRLEMAGCFPQQQQQRQHLQTSLSGIVSCLS